MKVPGSGFFQVVPVRAMEPIPSHPTAAIQYPAKGGLFRLLQRGENSSQDLRISQFIHNTTPQLGFAEHGPSTSLDGVASHGAERILRVEAEAFFEGRISGGDLCLQIPAFGSIALSPLPGPPLDSGL